jgi:hypothetical protein
VTLNWLERLNVIFKTAKRSKTNLSKLLHRMLAGEEIVIAKAGKLTYQ